MNRLTRLPALVAGVVALLAVTAAPTAAAPPRHHIERLVETLTDEVCGLTVATHDARFPELDPVCIGRR